MDESKKRSLIERYLDTYNAFDIDGMMSVLHSNIEFENISGGEVNVSVSGADAYRELAEKAKGLFSSRRQTITSFAAQDDQAFIGIDFEATVAADLPNGMKAGETLRLMGRSEFTFRDGKIFRITDIS